MSSSTDLQQLSASFQKSQIQLQSLIEARQQLDSQLSENNQVQAEFKQLTDSNQVYKLMGPVLMKVEQEEAKGNVEKRIGFIKGEIEKVEKQIRDVGAQAESRRVEILKIQQQQQQQQGQTQGQAQAQAA